MWHEHLPAAVAVVHSLAEDAPATSTPGGVIAGVIVALTGFLGAVTALVATVMGRRRSTVAADPSPQPSPLNTDHDADLDERDRRLQVLELFLWRQRFNPNRIITGEEPAGEVQYE